MCESQVTDIAQRVSMSFVKLGLYHTVQYRYILRYSLAFLFVLGIEVYLICNIILALGVQQNDSALLC